MCNCGYETFASDFNDQFCEPTGALLSLSGKQDIVGDVNVRAKEPSDLNAAKSKAHFEQVNLIISLSTHVAGDTLHFCFPWYCQKFHYLPEKDIFLTLSRKSTSK